MLNADESLDVYIRTVTSHTSQYNYVYYIFYHSPFHGRLKIQIAVRSSLLDNVYTCCFPGVGKEEIWYTTSDELCAFIYRHKALYVYMCIMWVQGRLWWLCIEYIISDVNQQIDRSVLKTWNIDGILKAKHEVMLLSDMKVQCTKRWVIWYTIWLN